MDEVLTTMPERSNICICDVDWRTFLNSLPIRKAHSLIYDEMWKEIPKAENNIGNILEMILKERSNEKRLEIITGYIKGWIAAWISGSAEEVDCNVPLFTYGIDSVGATALKSQIEKDLQLDFQVCLISNITYLIVIMRPIQHGHQSNERIVNGIPVRLFRDVLK